MTLRDTGPSTKAAGTRQYKALLAGSGWPRIETQEGRSFKMKKIDFVVVVAQRLMFSKTPDERRRGQLTSS